MDDLLSTPQARAGPTSRLLKRQSQGQGPALLGRPTEHSPSGLTGPLGLLGCAAAPPRTPSHSLNNSLRLLDAALGSPIP